MPERQAVRVLKKTMTAVGWRNRVGVTVIWTTDREMRRLNRKTRQCDRTTDVLSFPLFTKRELGARRPKRGGALPLELGDIVISVPEARRQAKANQRSFRGEIMLLLVHGALHLAGFGHAKPAARKKMFGLQNKILGSLNAEKSVML